LVTMVD